MRERDPGSKRKRELQRRKKEWEFSSFTCSLKTAVSNSAGNERIFYSDTRRSLLLQQQQRSEICTPPDLRSIASFEFPLIAIDKSCAARLSLFSLSLRSLRLPPSFSFPGPKSIRGVFHISSPRIQNRRHNPVSYFVTSFLPRQ